MKDRRRPPSVRRVAAAAAAAVVVVCGLPSDAAAQSLHLAELFADAGRLGDARAEVEAWFEIRGEAATDEERQHGLWLRGRLAEDRAAGLRSLERLVEAHPHGPYTAHALTWLADAASEAGDDGAAMAYRARVVRDFPDSAPAEQARHWLAARGLAVDEPAPEQPAYDSLAAPVSRDTATAVPDPIAADSAPAAPVRAPAEALPVDPPPVEDPRVDTAAAAPDSAAVRPDPAAADTGAAEPPVADTVPREAAPDTVAAAPEPEPESPAPVVPEFDEVPPGDPVPGAAEAGAFAVQIGAFRNPDGAAGLVDELVAAGFDARLVQVPINTLLRVRIGRFATLELAAAELERVRAGGYDGAVVSDARRETAVSR